jgi:hypothetical protein
MGKVMHSNPLCVLSINPPVASHCAAARLVDMIAMKPIVAITTPHTTKNATKSLSPRLFGIGASDRVYRVALPVA